MVGAVVGVSVVRKVARNDDPTTAAPTMLWLVVGMACVSLATAMEQFSALIYRLAYDGVIERASFDHLYDLTLFVVAFKLLAAISIAGSSAMLAALLYMRPDAQALRWGLWAGLITAAGWLALALVFLAAF